MSFLLRISSSSLIRNSFIYAFCDGINRAIPFLLLPFITHYLTPEDYGIITNFNVYVQILSVFGYICTAGALPVMFYKLEKEQVKRYVSNMIILNTGVTLLLSIIALCAFITVEENLGLSFLMQVLSLVVVWFAGITNLNMILWRCEEKPFSFGVYQISQSAFNAATTILFVIILLWGWQGRVYSLILATVVFGLLSIYVLHKRNYLEFEIDTTYIRQTVIFAVPIIPHALSFWFKGGADKIMLTNMCGFSENGLYSVALTWGSIAAMFLISFNNSYAPFLYKKLAMFDKDKSGTINEQYRLVKLIWMCIGATLVFVVVLHILSCLLIKWVYAPSFHASIEYLPWIMLGQFFYGGYLMFVCFAHYTFKTKILGIITFLWSIAQIGITYILIQYIGSVGAAISFAIVSAMTFLFVAAYGMRVYQLPWFTFLKND